MKNIKTISELNKYIKDNVPFIIDVPSYDNDKKNWRKEYEIKSLDLSFIITEKYDLIFSINQKYSNFYDLYISEEMLIKEVLQLIDDNKDIIYNIHSKRYELFNIRRNLLINSNFNKSSIYDNENIYFNVIDKYLSDVTRKGNITSYETKSFSCADKINFDKYVKDNETIFVIDNGIFYISYDIFVKNLCKFLKTTTIETIGILVDYIKSFGYYKYDIEFVENSGKFKDYDYYFSDEYKKYQTIIRFLNNTKKEENTFKTKYSNNMGVLCIVEEGRVILSHDKFIRVMSKTMKIDIISAVTLIKDYFKEIHQIKHDNIIIVDNSDKLDNYVIDDKLFENILNYNKKMSNTEYYDNIILKVIEDTNDIDETKLKECTNNTESTDSINKIDNDMKKFITGLFKEKDMLLVDNINDNDKEKSRVYDFKNYNILQYLSSPDFKLDELCKNTDHIDHDLSSCSIDTYVFKSGITSKSKNEILLENRITELEKQIDDNNKLLESILNKISL